MLKSMAVVMYVHSYVPLTREIHCNSAYLQSSVNPTHKYHSSRNLTPYLKEEGPITIKWLFGISRGFVKSAIACSMKRLFARRAVSILPCIWPELTSILSQDFCIQRTYILHHTMFSYKLFPLRFTSLLQSLFSTHWNLWYFAVVTIVQPIAASTLKSV